MSKSRVELAADLFQLHAALPLWRRVLGSEEAAQAHYRALATRVLAEAGEGDRAWVESCVAAGLASAWPKRTPEPEPSPSA